MLARIGRPRRLIERILRRRRARPRAEHGDAFLTAEIPVSKAAARENAPQGKKLVFRGSALLAQEARIDPADHGNIFRALHSPFDF